MDTHQIQIISKVSQRWHPLKMKAGTTIIFRSSKLPSNICPPPQSSHWTAMCTPQKRRTALHGMRTQTQASRKLNPYCKKALLKPLRYYDRNKPVTLQCDASLKGLRACIIQDGHPIAFVSKSLTDTETWYANIKRELLAIMYSCEKFHTYLYGITFTCWNRPQTAGDDKHEESHCSPSQATEDVSPTATVWHDHYVQTRQGNAPGWCPQPSSFTGLTHRSSLNLRVDAISMSAFTRSHLTKIAAETQWDPILSTVHRLTLNGWPNRCTNIPRITRNYLDFHDELSIKGWSTHERWMSHHPTILQRLYHGRSPQKPCRNQQGIGLG